MIYVYLILFLLLIYFFLYFLGKQFALRNRLEKADAIVCLAGTRGNINTLHERLDTAIELYKNGFAPIVIMSSKFSKRVRQKFKQPHLADVRKYADEGRITHDHINFAFNNWDLDLGADYMKMYAIEKGIPDDCILVENESLHTRENAKYTLPILKKLKVSKVILVTSPFHQRRAFEAFSTELKPEHIGIINYACASNQWNDFYWFVSLNNIQLVLREVLRSMQYRAGAK